MIRGLTLVAAMAALALPIAATAGGTTSATVAASRAAQAPLKSFGSCRGVKRFARTHPRALRRSVLPGTDRLDFAAALAPGEGASGKGTGDFSSTNVQEEGVDEPDIVKSDGSRILAIAGERLYSVGTAGGGPQLLDSLPLWRGWDEKPDIYREDLLLHADRALIISHAQRANPPWTEETVLKEVDLSDPSEMRIVRTMTVDATYVSARLNGPTSRVVISSSPDFSAPVSGRRSRIAGSAASNHKRPRWMPWAVLKDRTTGQKTKGGLLPCRRVSHPRRFSGLEMLTVLTIDLAHGLPAVDSDAIMTGGETVYGSAQNLYVATEQWIRHDAPRDRISDVSTAIHKFDITSPDSTEYRASGEVPGFMLSQWSMSERDGFLRVASTTEPPWRASGPGDRSQSLVSVLEEQSGRLAEVAKVGNLGRGEQIYAVRFIGDTAFVVTFRQVDPLYTIDLADPYNPRLRGELKIRGYSAYLHPIGDDMLLGIGQDATKGGETLGTQLSLFDVSDPSNPIRLDQLGFGPGAYSEVEFDHHAFLYSAPDGLTVLPIEVYRQQSRKRDFLGAVAAHADRTSGIQELARISHGAKFQAAVRRALVIGGKLYTLSEWGLLASDLETFAPQAWVEFRTAAAR